ncbi:MAG: omptin family outer membrane protease, partial [Treponema sp.]|nr:omptin family outer membrane protease [Treponema sp.]
LIISLGKIYSHCMFTIRKFGILVSIALLSLSYAVADPIFSPGGFRLNITPLTGILIGQSEEFLYKYPGKKQYESQLLWDLKPLFYVGMAADFGPQDPFSRNGFITAVSAKFGLPLKTGIIEDRDWDDKDYDFLTNYSKHDAYSQSAILADVSAGYSWRLADHLALAAYGEFSYMHFSWSAEDGYLQYTRLISSTKDGNSYDPNTIDNYSMYGPGIHYTQNWFIFAPAFSLKGRISKLFSVSGNFSYTPLVYCTDRDDHLLQDMDTTSEYYGTGKTFTGYFSIGTYISGGASFIYSPIQNVDLSLSLDYRYITGLRGNTFIRLNGVSRYASTGSSFQNGFDGGAGYSTLDITLAAKFLIF